MFVKARAGEDVQVGEKDQTTKVCPHGHALVVRREGQHEGRAGWGVCVSAGWVRWGGHCNNIVSKENKKIKFSGVPCTPAPLHVLAAPFSIVSVCC